MRIWWWVAVPAVPKGWWRWSYKINYCFWFPLQIALLETKPFIILSGMRGYNKNLNRTLWSAFLFLISLLLILLVYYHYHYWRALTGDISIFSDNFFNFPGDICRLRNAREIVLLINLPMDIDKDGVCQLNFGNRRNRMTIIDIPCSWLMVPIHNTWHFSQIGEELLKLDKSETMITQRLRKGGKL